MIQAQACRSHCPVALHNMAHIVLCALCSNQAIQLPALLLTGALWHQDNDTRLRCCMRGSNVQIRRGPPPATALGCTGTAACGLATQLVLHMSP